MSFTFHLVTEDSLNPLYPEFLAGDSNLEYQAISQTAQEITIDLISRTIGYPIVLQSWTAIYFNVAKLAVAASSGSNKGQ